MPTSHQNNLMNRFRRRIFVASLKREVARRSRDGGSLSLMKLHSLSRLRRQLPRRRSPLSLSPKSVGLNKNFIRLFTKPLSQLCSPKRVPSRVSSALGSMRASTPTKCALIELLRRASTHTDYAFSNFVAGCDPYKMCFYRTSPPLRIS